MGACECSQTPEETVSARGHFLLCKHIWFRWGWSTKLTPARHIQRGRAVVCFCLGCPVPSWGLKSESQQKKFLVCGTGIWVSAHRLGKVTVICACFLPSPVHSFFLKFTVTISVLIPCLPRFRNEFTWLWRCFSFCRDFPDSGGSLVWTRTSGIEEWAMETEGEDLWAQHNSGGKCVDSLKGNSKSMSPCFIENFPWSSIDPNEQRRNVITKKNHQLCPYDLLKLAEIQHRTENTNIYSCFQNQINKLITARSIFWALLVLPLLGDWTREETRIK